MKKQVLSILGVSILAFSIISTVGTIPVSAATYFGFDDYGGGWYDAEKSPSNTEDDFMCWAATASNVLAWTGWGSNFGNDADAIFKYYQDHWTPVAGSPSYAWKWWFDGSNAMSGVDGWSQVDVAGGSFWDPPYNFFDYFHFELKDDTAMITIADYLHAGYGVSLIISYDNSVEHAITAWGYDYDELGNYSGIWITDSDNSKSEGDNPPNILSYFDVALDTNSNRWYLQDYYYESSDWYIDSVMALDKAPVPVPATILLFGSGLVGLVGTRLIRKKK